MLSDFYRSLTKRAVALVSDGAEGMSETTTDTTIYGYLAELSGTEVLKNHQIGNDATSELFTTATLALTDRVADGATEYEIVWKFSNFHTHYLLKQVKV